MVLQRVLVLEDKEAAAEVGKASLGKESAVAETVLHKGPAAVERPWEHL